MRTGELAQRAGVNIQTIRFYERVRLLREPPRTPAGYRCYTEQDLERVTFVKQCQQLGFTLKDIQALAEPHRRMGLARDQASAGERRKIAEIARERLRLIDGKIRLLKQMRAQLRSLCDSAASADHFVCPVKSPKIPS